MKDAKSWKLENSKPKKTSFWEDLENIFSILNGFNNEGKRLAKKEIEDYFNKELK